MTKFMSTRRFRVRVCNVPAFLKGEILASFLNAYDRIETMSQLQSAAGTAHGYYVFRICLTREGFQAIPNTITSRERQMMAVIEGRRPHPWNCKQIGPLAKACLQKNIQTTDTTEEKPLKEAEIGVKPSPGTLRPSEFRKWIEASLPKKEKRGDPQKPVELRKALPPKALTPKKFSKPEEPASPTPKTLHTPGKPTGIIHQQRTPPSKYLWKYPTIWKKKKRQWRTL